MLSIRTATVEDAAIIRKLILELAEYERELNKVRTTEADISLDGFGVSPKFHALIAEWSGQLAGFALYFSYYSTWNGPGLYLEDLFVRPRFRRRGIGTALIKHIAHEAESENRLFIRWAVLKWNQPAIEMYKALGAEFLHDWCGVVLDGRGLKKLLLKSTRSGTTRAD